LTFQGGVTYDLAIRRTGQAAHYKLGSPDKRLEIGFAHSLLYLEHHEQAWLVNAAPNENVNISVLKDSPAIGGADPQATTMTYSVRRADCTVVVPSTTIPVSGTISFNAGSGGSFVIYFESMDGHFALRRNSGCDGGFYALPCPPKVQIVCPANIIKPNDPGQCGAIVSFAATATGVYSPTVTYSKAPGSFFLTGTTAVTATATDLFGETATCTFTVTVEDKELPVLKCPPDLVVECDGQRNPAALNAWLNSFSATDNCAIAKSGNDFKGLSDGCGATGSTTVTFTATDIHGNSASCTATFTIVDTTAPVLTSNVRDILPKDAPITFTVDESDAKVRAILPGPGRAGGDRDRTSDSQTGPEAWERTDGSPIGQPPPWRERPRRIPRLLPHAGGSRRANLGPEAHFLSPNRTRPRRLLRTRTCSL